VGYGSPDAKLVLLGPGKQGRVPVRVHGRLTLEAWVPERLLELRAQRSAALRGAPVVVQANDRVRVVSATDEAGKVRVQARPRWGDTTLGPFEGTLELAALAANEAPGVSEQPKAGLAYRLPARTALPLFDAPKGELAALLPPQPEPRIVRVNAVAHGWLQVQVGNGPYVVGFTNAPLALVRDATRDATTPPAEPSFIPRRIRETPGALHRLAPGTRVFFRGAPIATLRAEGWGRVLIAREHGWVEVLAACDEHVTVRGLVEASALLEADPSQIDEDLLGKHDDAAQRELAPAAE
jgi:hypothetical protein